MEPEVTTLANGLRVATHAMDHLETVSLGVWVAAGARHESEREHGLSHLLEHMAFKGTSSRSAQMFAEEIEEVGGELNAATGLDTTAYYARVLKDDEGVALELLADILLNSSFAEDELEREREVILQEIAGTQDSPEELAMDLLQETAFPGQSLGRPILGTPDSVTGLQAADIRAFLARHYKPNNMIVAAAGAINHEKLVRHVEALFGGLTPGEAAADQPARYGGGIAASEKPFEQSHLLVGFPSPSYRDDAFFAAQVFSGLFGGGMSSRLFQEIRERRGLCYAIYSTVWGLRDAGMLAVHAATGPDMVEELSRLVAAELHDLVASGPKANELQRSKAQIKAGLLMALESSSVRAEQMARQLIGYGRFIPLAELSDRVAGVTASHVMSIAESLARAAPAVTVVGSGSRSLSQADSARAEFAASLTGA
jgi:predicted Zn-dependent peptidase